MRDHIYIGRPMSRPRPCVCGWYISLHSSLNCPKSGHVRSRPSQCGYRRPGLACGDRLRETQGQCGLIIIEQRNSVFYTHRFGTTTISYTNYTLPDKRLKTSYCLRDGKVSALRQRMGPHKISTVSSATQTSKRPPGRGSMRSRLTYVPGLLM